MKKRGGGGGGVEGGIRECESVSNTLFTVSYLRGERWEDMNKTNISLSPRSPSPLRVGLKTWLFYSQCDELKVRFW